MRNKEQKGDLTVQAIAGTHVVLLCIDLPKKKCTGLLGFALRREDHTAIFFTDNQAMPELPWCFERQVRSPKS